MKPIALKAFVALSSAFAAYYLFFLGSVFYELYGPSARWCATPQVWALQAAAFSFAPMALLSAVALWFVGKQRGLLGAVFPKLSKASLVLLILCALVNLLVFIPG